MSIASSKPRPLKLSRSRAKGVIVLHVGHLEQRSAMTHERRMDIAPLAPLIGIDRENCLPTLLGRERAHEIFRRLSNRSDRYASFLDAEQTGNDVAVAGDTREQLRRRCQ